MEICETERLKIKEATLADSPFFLALLNTPIWFQYIGDRKIHTVFRAQKYIQDNLIDHYKTHGYGLYKVVYKGKNLPIGICGFLKRDFLDSPDIGFAFLPEYTRQGYALEAAEKLMAYGKDVLGFSKVLALTTEENSSSQKLLGKIGFSHVGHASPPDSDEAYLLFSHHA